jgi:hypothetical protein
MSPFVSTLFARRTREFPTSRTLSSYAHRVWGHRSCEHGKMANHLRLHGPFAAVGFDETRPEQLVFSRRLSGGVRITTRHDDPVGSASELVRSFTKFEHA